MSSTCKATDKARKQADKLFARFAVFYGHLWRSQFKSEGFLEFAKQEWMDGLKQFDEEIVNKAILEVRDRYEMPPTLPQVMRLCRDIKKRLSFYVAPKTKEKATAEVVERNIKQCKTFLNTPQINNS